MLAGPWQPRNDMCEASTAGVASVISAVETLPTFRPRSCAISRIVSRFAPGTFSALLGPCEIRSSMVFWPVAHIVPVEAESGDVVGQVRRGRQPASATRWCRSRSAACRSTFSLFADALVVTGRGDLRYAHAVADQEDDVLRADGRRMLR